jgi:hypothetical protein
MLFFSESIAPRGIKVLYIFFSFVRELWKTQGGGLLLLPAGKKSA